MGPELDGGVASLMRSVTSRSMASSSCRMLAAPVSAAVAMRGVAPELAGGVASLLIRSVISRSMASSSSRMLAAAAWRRTVAGLALPLLTVASWLLARLDACRAAIELLGESGRKRLPPAAAAAGAGMSTTGGLGGALAGLSLPVVLLRREAASLAATRAAYFGCSLGPGVQAAGTAAFVLWAWASACTVLPAGAALRGLSSGLPCTSAASAAAWCSTPGLPPPGLLGVPAPLDAS